MQTYQRYQKGAVSPGAIVIRLYSSGEEIRGFIREIAEPGTGDTIFPGEEMEPDAAFRVASNKNRESGQPVFVELTENVGWNPEWGRLV